MNTKSPQTPTKLKAGDIVWAKVKNYPFWPAVIININEKHAEVKFYGTQQTGTVKTHTELKEYTAHKDELCGKKAGQVFKNAIAEADAAVDGLQSKNKAAGQTEQSAPAGKEKVSSSKKADNGPEETEEESTASGGAMTGPLTETKQQASRQGKPATRKRRGEQEEGQEGEGEKEKDIEMREGVTEKETEKETEKAEERETEKDGGERASRQRGKRRAVEKPMQQKPPRASVRVGAASK